jgi:hypothetical protein
MAMIVIGGLVAACGAVVPAPSATPAPSVTPLPAPSDWTYLPWYDPDLEIAVPAGWDPITKFEAWSPDPSASPDVVAGAEWWNRKIANGAVRMQANASSASSDGSTRSLLVLVEGGDTSLEAFVARSVGEATYLGEVARHDAQFALGHAIVVDYITQASSYAGVSRDYHFRLADGRSLLVEVSDTGSFGASSAPDAATLGTLGDQIVATLRPHQ